METVLLLVMGIVLVRYTRKRLAAQDLRIAELQQALDRLQAGLPPVLRQEEAPSETAPAGLAPVPAGPPPDVLAADAVPVEPPFHEAAFEESSFQEPAAHEPMAEAPPRRSFLQDIERSLASRWLIWLGGATLALAAAFFIKLSVEHGWLGPSMRVALGLLAGGAFMAGGEWLRRRPSQIAVAAIRENYVPPALTAAGLFFAFASVYGGFALFGLFGPLPAFLLLAGLAFAALALALLQGPMIAALGLLGGYVTPALVASEAPSAWGFFAYLLALTAGGVAVTTYRDWRWLGRWTLAGAALWPLLWLTDMGVNGEDSLPVGAHLLLTALLFLLPAFTVPADAAPAPPSRLARWAARWPRWMRPSPTRLHPLERTAAFAQLAIGLLLVILAMASDADAASFLALALFALLCLAGGRRHERLGGIAWTAAVAVLLALAVWDTPFVPGPEPEMGPDGRPLVTGVPPGLPGEVVSFLWTAGGFAALFGAGGAFALRGASRPALWAAVASLTPVLLLALAYWQVGPNPPDILWPAVALALAALLVAATTPLARRRDRLGDLPLAAVAASATAAISLGATMALEEAWLTVALALQLPVLAWLEGQLNLPPLRRIALAVAAVVLVRLVANPDLLEYGNGALGWTLYGYGIPAAAFFLAGRRLRRRADDGVVAVLEAGALAFVALLIASQIHNLTAGGVEDLASSPLLEAALNTLAWLALAIGLAAGPAWRDRPVARWGRRILTGLAVLQVVGLHLLALNPLETGEPVGALAVLNLLLLAYGLPGLLLLGVARLDPLPALRRFAPPFTLLLIAVELGLEIRRAFHGQVLSDTALTDAEWYSYSAGFLGFAVLLLTLGLRLGNAALRHTALGLVIVVIIKVFVSDMADLDGLYRVASFFGLGLCLIGIGFLYQRLLMPAQRTPPDLRHSAKR